MRTYTTLTLLLASFSTTLAAVIDSPSLVPAVKAVEVDLGLEISAAGNNTIHKRAVLNHDRMYADATFEPRGLRAFPVGWCLTVSSLPPH